MGDNINSKEGITPRTVADVKLGMADAATTGVPKPNIMEAAPIEMVHTTPLQTKAKRSTVSVADKNKFEGFQISDTDPNEIAAQKQSQTFQLWQSTKAFVPAVADNVIKGAGFVGGAFIGAVSPDLDIMDTANKNVVTELGTDLNNYLNGVLGVKEIYHTRDYANTTNTWYKIFGEGAETVFDATAFLASAVVPGMAISKIAKGTQLVTRAVNATSKVAKLTSKANRAAKMGNVNKAADIMKQVKNLQVKGINKYKNASSKLVQEPGMLAKNAEALARGTNFMTMHAYNVMSEAGFEAQGATEAIMAQHLWDTNEKGEFINDTEMKALQKDAWSKVYGWNLALLSVTNIPEAKALFRVTNKAKTLKQAGKQWSRLQGASDGATKVKKAAYMGKEIGKSMITEGIIEEGGQLAVENYAMNTAGDTVKIVDATGQIFNNLLNNFTTMDGKSSMLVGALMGAIFGTTGSIQSYNDIKNQGTAHMLNMASKNSIAEDYRSKILLTNEDGTLKDGKAQFDIPAIQTLVEELKKTDTLKAAALQNAIDIDSKALHDYVLLKDFESIIEDTISLGGTMSDVTEDIEFFSKHQESIIEAMTPGVTKDELNVELRKRKQIFKEKGMELVESYKKAKGRAFSLYASGVLKENEVDQWAKEIYRYDVQAKSVVNLMHTYTNEVAAFEDKYKLNSSRKYNRAVGNLKYHKKLLVDTKAKLDNFDLSEAEIEVLNDNIKTIEGLIEEARKDAHKESKDFTKNEMSPYYHREDSKRKMSDELLDIYEKKVSIINDIEKAGLDSLDMLENLDNPENVKSVIEAKRKIDEAIREASEKKHAKQNIENVKEKINDSKDLVELEKYRSVADTTELKTTFDNKFQELKERNQEEANNETPKDPIEPDTTPDTKPPVEPEPKNSPENNDTLYSKLKEFIGDKFWFTPNVKLPPTLNMLDLYNAVEVIIAEANGLESKSKMDSEKGNQLFKALVTKLYLEYDITDGMNQFRKNLLNMEILAPTLVDNYPGLDVETAIKKFNIALGKMFIEVDKIKLEVERQPEPKPEPTPEPKPSESNDQKEESIITLYIPALHNRKNKEVGINKVGKTVLEGLSKLAKGTKAYIQRGMYKKQNTAEVYVDGNKLGNVHPPEYFEKELNFYGTIRDSLGDETSLKDWLENLNDETKLEEVGLEDNKTNTNLLKDLKRRSKMKGSKGTSTALDNFNGWIDTMTYELAVSTDIWNELDKNPDAMLEWEADSISNGGFRYPKEGARTQKVGKLIDFTEDELIYFKADKEGNVIPYNLKTGERMINIPVRNESQSGLVYMYTNKSLNGKKMLVALHPDVLSEKQQFEVKENVAILIEQFEEHGKGKTQTDESVEALKDLFTNLFEQDAKEDQNDVGLAKRNAYATSVSNLKDGKEGFVINLGNPNYKTAQIRLEVKDGKRVVSIYTYKDGQSSSILSTSKNFDAALNELISGLYNNGIPFDKMQQDEQLMEEIVSNMKVDIVPLFDTNGKVLSYTHPEGNGSSTNMNLRVRIKTGGVKIETEVETKEDIVDDKSTNSVSSLDSSLGKDKTSSSEPTQTYRDITVINDNNIVTAEGTRGAVRFDNKNKLIRVNKTLLKQKFKEKAWTNPRELIELLHDTEVKSIANKIDENQFKTYEEFETFVMEHEYQHSVYTREDFNKDVKNGTKGQYETTINNKVLEALGVKAIESNKPKETEIQTADVVTEELSDNKPLDRKTKKLLKKLGMLKTEWNELTTEEQNKIKNCN